MIVTIDGLGDGQIEQYLNQHVQINDYEFDLDQSNLNTDVYQSNCLL